MSLIKEPPRQVIVDLAVESANLSPCKKSKRGAVLYIPYEVVYGTGFNKPPGNLVCTGDKQCKVRCGKWCSHAESQAIKDAILHGACEQFCPKASPSKVDLSHYDLLHIKTVDGKPVPSGPPSCWQCAREVLETGIEGVWLLHEEGWTYYSGQEFHAKTMEYCGI